MAQMCIRVTEPATFSKIEDALSLIFNTTKTISLVLFIIYAEQQLGMYFTFLNYTNFR